MPASLGAKIIYNYLVGNYRILNYHHLAYKISCKLVVGKVIYYCSNGSKDLIQFNYHAGCTSLCDIPVIIFPSLHRLNTILIVYGIIWKCMTAIQRMRQD